VYFVSQADKYLYLPRKLKNLAEEREEGFDISDFYTREETYRKTHPEWFKGEDERFNHLEPSAHKWAVVPCRCTRRVVLWLAHLVTHIRS